MNVFVLCTGRCGSTAFAKACGHITNFTADHESKERRGKIGPVRWEFPDNHIEVDFRLAWTLGRLDVLWGKKAFYVHLTRDAEAVAKSFVRLAQIERGSDKIVRRFDLPEHLNRPASPLWSYMHVHSVKLAPIDIVAREMVESVNADITAFLKDKEHIHVRMEHIDEDFPEFWRAIGAEGDLDAALAEFKAQHNSMGELMAAAGIPQEPRRRVDLNVNIKNVFGAFIPQSKGSDESRLAMAMDGVRTIFPAMVELLRGSDCRVPEPMDIEDWEGDSVNIAEWALRDSFTRHGSDKSTSHDYHRVYGRFLPNTSAPYKIFEIGMGSTNPNVLSNMGANGHPGASLRAFAACYPNATIYGADIDRDILFQEDRISTFWADQTDPASLAALDSVIPDDLDLAIDDGLHAPHANINSLAFMLKKLKVGGWAVIEDIGRDAVPIWQTVAAAFHLSGVYQGHIVEAKDGHLFLVRRVL